MKTTLTLFLTATATLLHAQQSTLGEGDSYAWSGNLGWIEMTPHRPNPGDGFRFGEVACAGWIWSANTGWIHCGDGTPANGIYYLNENGTDYGVNHYATGDLYGLAWSPNTGWINFGWWTLEPNNPNRPRVDLQTGGFSGYVWGANTGWINLGTGILKTDSMIIEDSDNDGISDAWERAYADGDLTVMNGSSDFDKDGRSDLAEYQAMTNPLNPASFLKVTEVNPLTAGGTTTALTWTSSRTRLYRIETSIDLGVSDNWEVSPLDPQTFTPDDAATTTRNTQNPAAEKRFFRISPVIPLQP
jgi:hypothetical protein